VDWAQYEVARGVGGGEGTVGWRYLANHVRGLEAADGFDVLFDSISMIPFQVKMVAVLFEDFRKAI